MRKIIIYLVLSILLAACCINKLVNENTIMGIERGMTKHEVLNLLDTPKFRRLNHSMEEWEYHYEHTSKGNNVLLIRFVSGKVEDLENFYLPKRILEENKHSKIE